MNYGKLNEQSIYIIIIIDAHKKWSLQPDKELITMHEPTYDWLLIVIKIITFLHLECYK